MKILCWTMVAICALAAAIAGAFLFMIGSSSVRVTLGAAIAGALVAVGMIAIAQALLAAVVIKILNGWPGGK